MRLYGLIGYPLTHSFSKAWFTEKFEREGLPDCRYELFPLSSMDAFTELLSSQPGLLGLNVTVPYKKEVIPFLHDSSGIPSGLFACNCIRIRDGKLSGYNTDWIGFENSLIPMLKPHHQKALVFGTGGAAEAVQFVLKSLSIPFYNVSRAGTAANTISYKDITANIIQSHTLIINTTPVGMYPNVDACPDIPYQHIGKAHLLYDLVYNPAVTRFLQQGKENGAAIKNGEEMLVRQAEESWKIWNK